MTAGQGTQQSTDNPCSRDFAAEDRHLTSEHGPVDGVRAARQPCGPHNARHPGSAPQLAGGCMRGSTEAPHQVVASRVGTVDFREARAVQEFGTPVNRARKRRIARKEEIDRLPCPDPGGFEASAGWWPLEITHAKDSTSIRSADCSGIGPGSITWALWLVSEPFYVRIGSQRCKRTQPNRAAAAMREVPAGRKWPASLACNQMTGERP